MSVSRPCRFTPRVTSSGTDWIGGWVGPRVGLGSTQEKKICPCQESNPGCPARSYTDWALKDILICKLFLPLRSGVRNRTWSCGICGGTKWRWGRFSPSSSVSPALVVRSTNYPTITLIYHPGMHNRPMCGRSAGTYRDLGDLNKET
jgi:hypothetical protein